MRSGVLFHTVGAALRGGPEKWVMNMLIALPKELPGDAVEIIDGQLCFVQGYVPTPEQKNALEEYNRKSEVLTV